jgi:hypothetical protein
MRRFWKPHREDEVERFLRANRAEPRDEFVASMLERLQTKRRSGRPQRLGRRVAVAAAVTALAVGAGVAAGGIHTVGTSVSNLAHVGDSGINGSNADNGNDGGGSNWGGNSETSIPVCHHTSSDTHPWNELFLPPDGAANHLQHHPMDYIVGGPGNPAICPP